MADLTAEEMRTVAALRDAVATVEYLAGGQEGAAQLLLGGLSRCRLEECAYHLAGYAVELLRAAADITGVPAEQTVRTMTEGVEGAIADYQRETEAGGG